MNKILQDLESAMKNIPEFYYSMSSVDIQYDRIEINTENIKYYERRYVSQLKSEFDSLVKLNITGEYKEVYTDIEVIKRYIYCEKPDRKIVDTYNKLCRIDNESAFSSIVTIPDFFIHKEQENREEVFQKLAVEVKTVYKLKSIDFYLDLFKLNVYVDKYNFKNGVYILVNKDVSQIKKLINAYLKNDFYIAPKGKERIFFFIKKDFNSEIEILDLADF